MASTLTRCHWRGPDVFSSHTLTLSFSKPVPTAGLHTPGDFTALFLLKQSLFNSLQVSENLGKLYSEMIFVHGFVHCDPHPGNVLVQKCPYSQKSQIVLLDHGLYQVWDLQASYSKENPICSNIADHFSCCCLKAASHHNKPHTWVLHICAGLQQDKSFLINKPFDAECSFLSANYCPKSCTFSHTHTHTARVAFNALMMHMYSLHLWCTHSRAHTTFTAIYCQWLVLF